MRISDWSSDVCSSDLAVVPVSRILRDAGAVVDVTYSPGPKATLDLVAGAVERGDVVVSVGGDGMLSSIAGEVARLGGILAIVPAGRRSEEHTSELQSLMRISYAVFCLKKKRHNNRQSDT